MFNMVGTKTVEGHGAGLHAEIHNQDGRVVNVDTWAFASCACFSLHQWSSYNRLENKKDVEEFFNFLGTNACTQSWKPGEFYFLLTEDQVVQSGKFIVKHPCVKLRDHFMNKSHDDRIMYLYRYSETKDFNETP